jgi:hypothetical protein
MRVYVVTIVKTDNVETAVFYDMDGMLANEYAFRKIKEYWHHLADYFDHEYPLSADNIISVTALNDALNDWLNANDFDLEASEFNVFVSSEYVNSKDDMCAEVRNMVGK